jgi:hypothetical protein
MLGNSVPYGDPDSALETMFSSWRAGTEIPNKGLSPVMSKMPTAVREMS